MRKPLIGILAYREGAVFFEPDYFRRLIAQGREMGADVFLFSPQDVDTEARQIKGYVPAVEKGWKERLYAWPDVVIDQYRYYPLEKHKGYLPFRQQSLFLYANSRFANKWRVHHVLAADEIMNRWLPESRPFSKQNVAEMLGRYPLLYIKPTNGSGGRSILCVEKRGKGYVLRGRTKIQGTKVQKITSQQELLQRLHQWVHRQKHGNELFFIQQGLRLDLLPNRTIDTRLLIQKNGEGEWKVTGMGVRVGGIKSSTSNLHGGGRAVPAGRFFASRFGQEKARKIIRECGELAHRTVQVIEQHYGSMLEFGLDIGVDVTGRVWLIETNPKPGREILRKTGQLERYQLAIRRPLEYALYLIKQQKRAKEHIS
ncbi:YheC/YheD family endospore coat-associated protein [Brevibacillus migulae]|uniref:YheC/YheD family endospore coat-associated protein n=1 Tax=Brevibacillus migulae TaxID=1644114 RepID=UPI00106E1F99|nr:YheC/YheD family protein [Brevibacillus migulae]